VEHEAHTAKCFSAALLSAVLLVGCAAQSTKTAASAESAAADASAAEASQPTLETDAPEPEQADDAPAPATTDLKLGSSVEVTGSDSSQGSPFTLTVAAVSVKSLRKAPGEYDSPPTNGLYAGVLITYACTKGKCDYNPYDFVLRAADGAEADQTFVTTGYKPSLQSGTLRAGTKARGYVVYDVTPGRYQFEYRANIFDGEPASWDLTLR
jgi:hypothetical protein